MKHIYFRTHGMFSLLGILFSLFWGAIPAYGAVDCEALAAKAGSEKGIPKHLLPAIARAESGKSQGKLGVRAWPWTLNVAGKGYYFRTKDEALEHLKGALKRGVKNIDIGCMQVNYRWHGDQFENVEQMMDPYYNTRYAAKFLSQLRQNTKDWMTAATHYHSKTPRHANRYRKVLQKIIAKEPGQTTIAQAQLADGVIKEAPSEPAPPRRLALAKLPATGDINRAMRIYETDLVPRGTIDMRVFASSLTQSNQNIPRQLRKKRDKIEYFRQDFAAR